MILKLGDCSLQAMGLSHYYSDWDRYFVTIMFRTIIGSMESKSQVMHKETTSSTTSTT
jgi:hypothetical protein